MVETNLTYVLSPQILARAQFALNITFHILFPSITVALSWFLLFFKWRQWMDAYFFWTKVFALCFALGVVSGVTMSFQFGTNWPGFMQKVGNVAGPLLAYEILTAFFMEATFLGIMLFGYRRVAPWVHTSATILVAAGTTLSAFWILALNSWMQTPAGYEVKDGIIYPTHWWQVIFNPIFPYHFIHMMLASGLTAAFLVAGISAYRWLRGDKASDTMRALKTGIFVAAILIPAQIIAGDLHGLATRHHQPQKIAAIEALWETRENVPLVLFARPNEQTRHNDWAIELPNMGSLILTHSWHGRVRGLNEFKDNHPPVAPLFFGFRLMVGIGLLMLGISWLGTLYLLTTQALPRWLAHLFVYMTFSGWVGTVAGWYVTEMGRQPWLVFGILRTQDAAASNVTAPMIGISLTAYSLTYVSLIIAFISTLFYMAQKAQHD